MSKNFESFGKYILLEKIQTGGMAEIYLARRPGASGVSKFLAIKRILPQFCEQTEFIEMFKDEAKIAVNLSHANIVSIHEFGIESNQFFLAMDYVEGRNLRQILNKMKKSGVGFSVEQVLYIIKEVAGGLDHAHRCIDNNTGKPLNIIHRDMSPQNVMVSFEGEVKVVDFGIAKAETQLDNTRAGTLKGKFGYMSPEQAEGQSVDLRTDIFALGIVLWELLANDRLFVANNEVNTLRKVRDCQIPSLRKINPNIPAELERIVSKALAKDRNLRYQTAAAFHRELSRFLNRQYPDFSPHDFSVFIKTLFAAEILDSRKKMIEFAKIDIAQFPAALSQSSDFNRVDSFTGSSTSTENSFGPAEAPRAPAQAPARQQPRSMNLGRDAPPESPQRQGRPQAPPAPIQLSPKSVNTSNLSVDRTGYRERDMTESFPHTYHGTRSFSHVSIKTSSLSSFMPVVLIACAIGLGTLFFGERQFKGVYDQIASVFGFSPISEPGGKIDIASTIPTWGVAISSEPSGAVVEIDGKPLSDTTPTNIRHPQNTPAKISVRLPGYHPQSKDVVVSSNLAIEFRLLPEKMAKLDVTVVGSGEIYVNGKKVADSSPLLNYPVRANQEIVVKAVDPMTRLEDERRITVAENELIKITLRPGAYLKRVPNSKKQ